MGPPYCFACATSELACSNSLALPAKTSLLETVHQSQATHIQEYRRSLTQAVLSSIRQSVTFPDAASSVTAPQAIATGYSTIVHDRRRLPFAHIGSDNPVAYMHHDVQV